MKLTALLLLVLVAPAFPQLRYKQLDSDGPVSLAPIAAPSAHATEDRIFQDTSDTTLKVRKSTAGGGALVSLEGGGGITSWEWVPAADFFVTDSTGSNWGVDVGCGVAADTLNTALTVVRCDDTTSEGGGWETFIPTSGATDAVFATVSRAQSAPGGAVGLQWAVACRTIADNSAIGTWSAFVDLTVVALGANTSWQIDQSTIPLTSLNLVADQPGQCQFAREPVDADDTLVGDATLAGIAYKWE